MLNIKLNPHSFRTLIIFLKFHMRNKGVKFNTTFGLFVTEKIPFLN